jgi:hypothetical protein
MSVNKLTYLLHLRVFFFIFADYLGFRLSGKIYFPTNPDNQESTALNMLFLYFCTTPLQNVFLCIQNYPTQLVVNINRMVTTNSLATTSTTKVTFRNNSYRTCFSSP